MIGAAALAEYASPLPGGVAERFADGARSSWESGDFQSLFEEHLEFRSQGELTGPGEAPGSSPISKLEVYNWSARADAQESTDAESSSDPSQPVSTSVLMPAGRDISVDADAAEAAVSVQARIQDSGDAEIVENQETASTAPPHTENAEGATPRPITQMVLAGGNDQLELYVRDGALGAQAAMGLAQAASRLLQEHRLTLGRCKINGQVVLDDDGVSTSSWKRTP